jgi:imidazolonepropionase-like amidohydrolase
MTTISRFFVTFAVFTLVFRSFGADDGNPTKAAEHKKQTLIQNVLVFDGIKDELSDPTHVLIEDNKIARISPDATAMDGATIIDGQGKTLMPGLIDTHVHITWTTLPQASFLTGLPEYNAIHSTVDAKNILMRGFTSVRDMGGNCFGLKLAIDQGLVPGPRIYASGGPLSQTAGHGDFRFPNQTHPRFGGDLPPIYQGGAGYLVDGVSDVLAATRENLRHGASQIKLMAGGGYASPADPLLGNQFTFSEIKAAVDAATDWGTYVTIHSYHPSAINRAIDAGIKDVGHGQLLDKETLERMAKEGVFLSTQPFTVSFEPQLDDFSNSKLAQVAKGTAQVYKWAKEIEGLKVTYGTDMFFLPSAASEEQAKMMERLLPWFEPVEILRMATSTAGELLKMSGPMRDPYLEGTLGLVKVGNYADVLLVEGNPLEDLKAVTDSDNLKIIMKDGVIFKNTLEQ